MLSTVFIQQTEGVPGILTEHSMTSYNKIRHKPSHQGLAMQPSRKKGVPEQAKLLPLPHSHCQECYENQKP